MFALSEAARDTFVVVYAYSMLGITGGFAITAAVRGALADRRARRWHGARR